MAYSPPFVQAILVEATAIAPNRSNVTDGAVRTRPGPPSDHYADGKTVGAPGPVHAVDVTHDPAGGFDSYHYAEIVREKCEQGRETRIKYVVSYDPKFKHDIIASPRALWKWRKKEGRAHANHVHISILSGAQVEDSTAPLFNTATPPVVLPAPPSLLKGRPTMLEQPLRPGEGPRDPTRPQVARIEPADPGLIWLHNGASVAGDAAFGPSLRYLRVPTTADNPLVDLIPEDGAYGLAGFIAVSAKGHGHFRVWS